MTNDGRIAYTAEEFGAMVGRSPDGVSELMRRSVRSPNADWAIPVIRVGGRPMIPAWYVEQLKAVPA